MPLLQHVGRGPDAVAGHDGRGKRGPQGRAVTGHHGVPLLAGELRSGGDGAAGTGNDHRPRQEGKGLGQDGVGARLEYGAVGEGAPLQVDRLQGDALLAAVGPHVGVGVAGDADRVVRQDHEAVGAGHGRAADAGDADGIDGTLQVGGEAVGRDGTSPRGVDGGAVGRNDLAARQGDGRFRSRSHGDGVGGGELHAGVQGRAAAVVAQPDPGLVQGADVHVQVGGGGDNAPLRQVEPAVARVQGDLPHGRGQIPLVIDAVARLQGQVPQGRVDRVAVVVIPRPGGDAPPGRDGEHRLGRGVDGGRAHGQVTGQGQPSRLGHRRLAVDGVVQVGQADILSGGEGHLVEAGERDGAGDVDILARHAEGGAPRGRGVQGGVRIVAVGQGQPGGGQRHRGCAAAVDDRRVQGQEPAGLDIHVSGEDDGVSALESKGVETGLLVAIQGGCRQGEPVVQIGPADSQGSPLEPAHPAGGVDIPLQL